MKEIFTSAYHAQSFDPENRAEYEVNHYFEILKEDLQSVENKTNKTSYTNKFLEHLKTIANKESRCLSPMITGPANFPVRRNNKNRAYAEKARSNFDAWRKKRLKKSNPTLPPEKEITKQINKHTSLVNIQEIMKAINKIVRDNKLSQEQKIEKIKTYGYTEKESKIILDPNLNHREPGFPAYALRNNLAKIKRCQQFIVELKARLTLRDETETITFFGGSISIQNNRVVIKHDEKPEKQMIKRIKSKGFRWSPKYKSWSRKFTKNALNDAKNLVIPN